MFESQILNWYSPQTVVGATETGAPEKADYIIPPHGEVLQQTCQGRKEGFQQIGCKWFVKSSYNYDGATQLCIYDKFDGLACDKVIVKGKGIN